jgi:hypothetical protein
MNDRIAGLEAAIRAQGALTRDAQEEIINYLSAQIGPAEFTDRMIRLFDGQRQREVQRRAREALDDGEPGDIE